MCHMIADTDDELHGMAALLALKREWFQGDHYDVGLAVRARAVLYGAKKITQRECAAMIFLRSRGQAAAPPETAEARMCDAMNYSKTGRPVEPQNQTSRRA